MGQLPNFASVAFLISDPARAIILTTLLDGGAHPAGELAAAAGVTAQTASSHLSKLLAGGMVLVESVGRTRCYRLSGSHVGRALEALAEIKPAAAVRRKASSQATRDIELARCCYDHLAGAVGVAVTDRLQARGFLIPVSDNRYDLSAAGAKWFSAIGVSVTNLKAAKRGIARQCLDSTERQHHLAGPLGTELLTSLCAKGWLQRSKTSRVVHVTPKGWVELNKQLGLDRRSLQSH